MPEIFFVTLPLKQLITLIFLAEIEGAATFLSVLISL
jgi:hypothetical protein